MGNTRWTRDPEHSAHSCRAHVAPTSRAVSAPSRVGAQKREAEVVTVVMLMLSLPAVTNFSNVQELLRAIRRPLLTLRHVSFLRFPWGHTPSPPRAPLPRPHKSLLVCWPRTSSAGTGLNPHAFERWWPGTAKGQAFASAAQKLAGPSA